MISLATYGDRSERIHDRHPMLRIAREIHRNDRGDPILFASRPYLIALYVLLPRVDEAVFRKAVQTGISEALIQLILYKAGWQGRKTAYALPKDASAALFVTQRINPLVETVPAYRERLPFGTIADRKPEVGSVALKMFGRGSMRFMGGATRSNWLEWSADTLIADEVDEFPADNLAMAKDRVQASKDPQLIYVGNPTSGGVGIDARYAAGDRSQWFTRCARCGHRQALDWLVHFVEQADDGRWVPQDRQRADHPELGDIRPVCPKCRRPFEREADGAQWVAERTRPGLVRSFTITHMDDLTVTVKNPQPMRAMYAEWVAAQSDDAALVRFWRSKCGRASQPKGSSLTVDVLRAATLKGAPMDPTGASTAGELIVMSSDVGSTFHVTISQIVQDMSLAVGYRRVTRWLGTTHSWTGLDAIHERYAPGITVVDAGPETTAAREWCARAEQRREGAKAYRCAFHKSNQVAGKELGFHKSTQDRLVTVDRTQAMDRAFYDLRDGLHVLPSDALSVPDWSAQMTMPVRAVKENGDACWTKGNDHYRLSDTYGRVGLQIAARSGCLASPARK